VAFNIATRISKREEQVKLTEPVKSWGVVYRDTVITDP